MEPNRKVISTMSAVEFDERHRGYVQRLIEGVRRRTGLGRAEARTKLARDIGVPPSTLENMLRNPPRLKGLKGFVAEKIAAAHIRGLEADIEQLQHELDLIRQTIADPRDPEFLAASTALAKARELVAEVVKL